jgi:uncharacterized membrane protein
LQSRTPETVGVHKLTFFGRLRAYLLAGILVTAPIGITLYLTWVVVTLIDRQVMPLIPLKYNPASYLPFSVPGLGVVIMLVVLIFIGWITAGLLGRWMVRLSHNVLAAMPVVRNIYGAIKQIMDTVLAQQSNAFREVVLVQYPRRGIWTLGFITGRTEGEVQSLMDADMVNVYVPTTPNPTSGFLLFFPREDLHVLDMTVEEGIKMVISLGIVTPPDRRSATEQETPLIHVEGADPPDRRGFLAPPEPPALSRGRSKVEAD